MQQTEQVKKKRLPKYRQGDVLIERVAPLTAEFTPTVSHVLRHGTATGHSHIASCPNGLLLVKEINGQTYIKVAGEKGVKGVVSHEEHATIELPRGDYKITIQEQYSPQGYRKVID